MADKRAYFRVDVGYLSNPKIAPLLEDHPRAILLHLQCIAYASQHLTDGVVPMRLAMRLACAEQCDLDLLLQNALLLRLDSTNVVVHDYLEHQRSAVQAKAASDKGKQAADARWGDAPSNASGNASGMLTALPNPMPREREEKEDICAPRFDDFWDVYPLKRGKDGAKRAWTRAVKRADAQEIIDGAATYAESVRNIDDRQKIKYPQGWLNDGRWADEMDRPANSDDRPWWAS